MSAIETHARRRISLLLINATAFALWQGSQMTALTNAMDRPGVALIAPVGIILWLTTLVLLLLKRPKDARIQAQMEDELTQHNRLLAFNWGYGITMACTAAGLVLASVTTIPAIDIVRAIMIAGVAAPLIRFALMERSDAGGE